MAANNSGHESPQYSWRSGSRNDRFHPAKGTPKCSPPFKMVISDKRGAVVFEGKVSKDNKGRPLDCCAGSGTLISLRLHCSGDPWLVTRTFLIECATPTNSNN